MIRPGPFGRGLAAVAMLAWSGVAITAQPFADVHVHFNWDQRELIGAVMATPDHASMATAANPRPKGPVFNIACSSD